MRMVSRKRLLMNHIADFLAGLEAAGRQPDRWESERLIRALAALRTADFAIGEHELAMAECASDRRSFQACTQTIRRLPTVAQHRGTLEQIKAEWPRGFDLYRRDDRRCLP